MATANRQRSGLLLEIAQCLMRLAEARTSADSLDALAAFLERLTTTWYAVDVFTEDRFRRRLLSHRCPRSLAPFVARLGFTRRPDGSYPGTFAESTLILVKVGAHSGRNQCLVCALGLQKDSPLNDGTALGCVGMVINEALSRTLWFEEHARRAAMLSAFLTDTDEFAVLVDSRGEVVDQYPPGASSRLPPGALQEALQQRRRSRSTSALGVKMGNRDYLLRLHWMAPDRPLNDRYLLIHGRARAVATALPVAERLKSYGLSKRESQVAELVFTGRTNQLIAQTLYISADTVKTHCRHIFGKLGISRRTEFLKVVGE